jgi:hypothetical protein
MCGWVVAVVDDERRVCGRVVAADGDDDDEKARGRANFDGHLPTPLGGAAARRARTFTPPPFSFGTRPLAIATSCSVSAASSPTQSTRIAWAPPLASSSSSEPEPIRIVAGYDGVVERITRPFLQIWSAEGVARESVKQSVSGYDSV